MPLVWNSYNIFVLTKLFRTNGAHLEFGLTTPDPEEAALKALAIHQAETAYVLLDHTKFNEVTFTKVEELESVTLLTDYCPAESLQGFQQKLF